ncbi:unnamed protein product [Parnassius apollo]|uniref:(apollo) hypothetical protein n=1 Tax=Parnassius apollo TaxID=110799 RepID=A0A8S3W811_PARAO|nr:unnamed protein product [Parnassius apollo]
MLKESTRYDSRNTVQEEGRPLASSRLPAIEELTLGLKQKLHLQARARAAPYYIRKQEPVDLVESCESVERVVKSLECKKRVGLQWCYMRRACENEMANYDVSGMTKITRTNQNGRRFLASGQPFKRLSSSFRMGKTTVTNIVYSTCRAMWKNLVDLHMPKPTEVLLKRISEKYYEYQFPLLYE